VSFSPTAPAHWPGQLWSGGLSGGRGVTQELVAAADWFDFAHFVGVDRRAQLLVQHGRADQTAPIEAGRELFAAAAQPKPWAEYDWDHGLDADPQARRDRAEFVVNGAISSSSTSAEKRSTTPEEPDRSASGRHQRSVIASALDGAHPASLRQTAPRKGPFRSGNHQGRASGFAAALQLRLMQSAHEDLIESSRLALRRAEEEMLVTQHTPNAVEGLVGALGRALISLASRKAPCP